METNFVMDTCGGQNMNQHVLWLLHFIVKRGIAKVARAIFLVQGNTKNEQCQFISTVLLYMLVQ